MAVFALLALSFFAACGMTYLLASDAGNRWLCSFVSAQIKKGFAGRMEIERIEDLKLDSIVARGVRFFPPDSDVAAIDVPRVVMDFSPTEMVRGQYGWKRAAIERPLVRVSEGANGKVNMEELFASPKKDEKKPKDPNAGSPVSMQEMITKDATLLIYGGSMPKLDLTHLDGVMRIDIAPNGDTVLRFDDYKGHLSGLPTGELEFQDVAGNVWTEGKKLLHFAGDGKSEGEAVSFDLDITRKPTDVHIGAEFEEVTKASMHARMVGIWTKFASNLDLDVRQRKE